MTEPTTDAPQGELEKGTSLWADAGRRLLRNKAALAGALVVTVAHSPVRPLKESRRFPDRAQNAALCW